VAWGQPCRAIIAKHGNPPDEPSEANCHVCQVEMRWGCHRLAVRVAPRPSGRLSRYNGEPTLNASGPHGPRGQLDGRHPPPRSRTCPAVSWASERAAIRFLRRRRAGRLPTNAAEPFSGLGHRLSRPEESAQDGTSLLHSTTTTERLCCRLGAIECAAEPTVMWHARLTCRGLARRCALGEGVWCTRTKRYLESNPYSCSTYYVRTLHFATCEPKKPRQAHEHALHQSHAGHGCRCQTVRPRH